MADKKHAWVQPTVDYLAPLSFIAVILVTRNFQLATWVLVGASALSLIVGWVMERRIAPIPLFAGLMALVFGTLTLVFHDPKFVKMKMTFVDTALGTAVLSGLFFKRMPIKALMGGALEMPDPAWRTLSLRYGLFFLACAVINEAVWRTQTDARWAIWRLVAIALAVGFSFFQVPLIMKHMDDPDAAKADPES